MAEAAPTGRTPLPAAIREGRVVAIGRRLDPARVMAIADALRAGGIRAFELTLDAPSDEPLHAIAALTAGSDGDELLIGAGTVMSVDAARRAVEAGARFLVAPHTDPAVVAWAVARGVPVIPGAATPTEIVTAWDAGATAVKLFPISSLGAGFVREVRGPLPDIPYVATGGVTLEVVPALFAAGVAAIGMGGWLTGDADPAVVVDRARQVVEVLAGID